MSFDRLIEEGWADHDRDPAGVAKRLEAGVALVDGPAQAGRFVALVNHVLGNEQRNWAAAARLARQAIERVAEPSAELAPALLHLAAASYLAGEVAPAMTAELRAAALVPESVPAAAVRVRLLVAEGLMGSSRWSESLALLGAALAVARVLPSPSPADRAAAVVANNVTSALLEKPDRTPAEDGFLEQGALAAREFWLRAGTWVNHERADFLLALVYNALGRPEPALAAARSGLETIAKNGEEPVDAAFLQVTAAHALRALGRAAEQALAIAEAERLALGFPNEALRSSLEIELAKAR